MSQALIECFVVNPKKCLTRYENDAAARFLDASRLGLNANKSSYHQVTSKNKETHNVI